MKEKEIKMGKDNTLLSRIQNKWAEIVLKILIKNKESLILSAAAGKEVKNEKKILFFN